MANKKITELTSATSVTTDAVMVVVNNAGTTPTTNKVDFSTVKNQVAFAPVISVTGDTTVTKTSHEGYYIRFNKATAGTLTIDPQSSSTWSDYAEFYVEQTGAGQVTIVGGSGVTVNAADGYTKTAKQYAVVAAKRVASDVWTLIGYRA